LSVSSSHFPAEAQGEKTKKEPKRERKANESQEKDNPKTPENPRNTGHPILPSEEVERVI